MCFINKELLMKYMILILIIVLSACTTAVNENAIINDLDVQLDAIAENIINTLQNENQAAAITEFTDVKGNISELGMFIAEELTTKLYKKSKLEIVERQMLKKILKEQNLGLSGFIDEQTAVSIGNILGADAIITGTITVVGKYIRINARVISTKSGKVLSAASASVIKDNDLLCMLGAAVSTTEQLQKKENYFKEIERNDLKIKLLQAEVKDRTLYCDFEITNLGKDDILFEVTYGWQYNTKVFDQNSNEVIISSVKFGNNTTKIKGLSQYDCASKKIIAGCSAEMTLVFEKVDPEINKILLLQILSGNTKEKYEFRNIPVSLK